MQSPLLSLGLPRAVLFWRSRLIETLKLYHFVAVPSRRQGLQGLWSKRKRNLRIKHWFLNVMVQMWHITNSLVNQLALSNCKRADQCRKACLCCGGSRALGQGHIGSHHIWFSHPDIENIISGLYTNRHIQILQWPQTIPLKRSCHLPEMV